MTNMALIKYNPSSDENNPPKNWFNAIIGKPIELLFSYLDQNEYIL